MPSANIFVIRIRHEGDWWYHGKYRTRDSSEAFRYDSKVKAELICGMLRYESMTVESATESCDSSGE
jgi:hypothetical protein